MGFTSPLMYQASLKTSLMSYCSAPQPVPRAAAVSDVTYTAGIKFPSGCPCKDKQHDTKGNSLVAYVSYTAVSISLRAKNAASSSPTVTKHIPDVSTSDLRGKACVRVSVCVSKCNEQFPNSKPKSISSLSLQLARTHPWLRNLKKELVSSCMNFKTEIKDQKKSSLSQRRWTNVNVSQARNHIKCCSCSELKQ